MSQEADHVRVIAAAEVWLAHGDRVVDDLVTRQAGPIRVGLIDWAERPEWLLGVTAEPGKMYLTSDLARAYLARRWPRVEFELLPTPVGIPAWLVGTPGGANYAAACAAAAQRAGPPPLGVMPAFLWREQHPAPTPADRAARVRDLEDAYGRYVDAGLEPACQWLAELREHYRVQAEEADPAAVVVAEAE